MLISKIRKTARKNPATIPTKNIHGNHYEDLVFERPVCTSISPTPGRTN